MRNLLLPPRHGFTYVTARAEIIDNQGHLILKPNTVIDTYPLRSVFVRELENCGLELHQDIYSMKNMEVPRLEYYYWIENRCMQKILNWLYEPDTNPTLTSLAIDNSLIYRKQEQELILRQEGVMVNKLVWDLLIKYFGGGVQVAYKKYKYVDRNFMLAASSSTHPGSFRRFYFNYDTIGAEVKQEICEAFGVTVSESRLHCYSRVSNTFYCIEHALCFNKPIGYYSYTNQILVLEAINNSIPHYRMKFMTLYTINFALRKYDSASLLLKELNIKNNKIQNFKLNLTSTDYLEIDTFQRGIEVCFIRPNFSTVFADLSNKFQFLKIRYTLTKQLLLSQKNTCVTLIIQASFRVYSEVFALFTFHKLAYLEISDKYTILGNTKTFRVLFKVLNTSTTIRAFRCSSFYGRPTSFENSNRFNFYLNDQISKEVKIPFELSNLCGVQFDITSRDLVKIEVPFTRRLISALIREGVGVADFPVKVFPGKFSWILKSLDRKPITYIV